MSYELNVYGAVDVLGRVPLMVLVGRSFYQLDISFILYTRCGCAKLILCLIKV